jgi:hypothetical protein
MSTRVPAAEYHQRLIARQKAVANCRRRDRLVANLRLLSAILFFVALWAVLARSAMSAWWLAIPVAMFVAFVIYHEHLYRLGHRAERAVRFYERGLARIEDRWYGMGDTRSIISDDSHPYVSDLDIFGKGSLFELLSNARTRAGEVTLANWLCAPASRPEILRRQQAIDELRNNIDLREDLTVLGTEVGGTIHPELMREWGSAPLLLNSQAGRTAAAILAGLGFFSVCSYLFFDGNGWLALIAIGIEAAFGRYYRRPVAEVIANVDRPARDLEVLSFVLARLEQEHFISPLLQELRGALNSAGTPASKRIKSLARLLQFLDSRLNVLFKPLAALLLWSTQLTFAIEAWRRRSGPNVGPWIDAVGELEALCALSGYAYEHPDDPFPDIVEAETRFEGEDMTHPLLPHAKCVPNSIQLDRERQLLVVSGSNMSGKSTLLRTVGINTVLALAGAPVRAKRIRLSVLQIGATIRVLDSLQAGTSRFYAEIQRLRDIMESTKRSVPVLFLLDEILHGTNSHDRAVGAEAVVRGLIARGAIGLVTTHDLALARLADALAPKALNVHFEDHLENARMVFDYKLRPGVVQKSNALELMRAVGLEV